jgi:hypothetical protein
MLLDLVSEVFSCLATADIGVVVARSSAPNVNRLSKSLEERLGFLFHLAILPPRIRQGLRISANGITTDCYRGLS